MARMFWLMMLVIKETLEQTKTSFLDDVGYTPAHWTRLQIDITPKPFELGGNEESKGLRAMHNKEFHQGNKWSAKYVNVWDIENSSDFDSYKKMDAKIKNQVLVVSPNVIVRRAPNHYEMRFNELKTGLRKCSSLVELLLLKTMRYILDAVQNFLKSYTGSVPEKCSRFRTESPANIFPVVKTVSYDLKQKDKQKDRNWNDRERRPKCFWHWSSQEYWR